jgi:hypothetical protein
MRLTDSEIRIILNLLPEGDVPKGLDPTFYHTLTYEGDARLQVAADYLRDKLTKQLKSQNKSDTHPQA